MSNESEKVISEEQIRRTNKGGEKWVVIRNKVYDVSQFGNNRPSDEEIVKSHGNLYVGDVEGKKSAGSSSITSFLPKDKAVQAASSRDDDDADVGPNSYKVKYLKASPFGNMVPYSDPNWYQNYTSPYYNQSHIGWRKAIRESVDKIIAPYVHQWDEAGAIPRSVWHDCYAAGWFPACAGSPWPVEYVPTSPLLQQLGIEPQDFDPFHELILIDEVARCGSGGVAWALFAGICIGLPPVLAFAEKSLRLKVGAEVLKGEKIICLAITEPYAGSDVANLQCRAEKVKREDGTEGWIVNGEKKWITNGVFADYFTVAVRTGGTGMGGVSLLLIERNMEGVSTKQMKCSGVWPSGTAYVTFEDVFVPVSNLIGKENKGFKYIMYNFNHERFQLIGQAIRFARCCVEEAFTYAHKRVVFGKKLIEQGVIREKLGRMIGAVEATQAWTESVAFQLKKMTKEEGMVRLGGSIALLKVQTTRVLELCARESCQVLGGIGYTRGGVGEKVERLGREVRSMSIPGGSEEIMMDLAVRQAMKIWQFIQNMKMAEESSGAPSTPGNNNKL
eukprot:TRINITY_DN467_c0_g2_i1.p1 TRINITY_DN467_c0_g2~~TRINITY_DN467_c0_g2_i1.p1  ORF type:complete len:573 (-),score=202.00 TRINITY_DN467_c0_g2_i1:13-1689(-)